MAEQKAKGPLLGRIDEIKSAKEFLEECTYYIGLKGKPRNSNLVDLYEVHSSCAYNECMQYAPVLLKITSQAIS